MIRFSAVLVVAAIGVLIGGIATSKLLLVYVAIGLSAVALVALAIGVVLKREELFSEQGQALAPAAAGAGADEPLLAGKPSTLPNGLVDPPDTPLPAGAAAAFGQAARGAERSGQNRSGHPAPGQRAYGQPAYGQAAPPAREGPPSGNWSGREAPPGTDWSGTMARQPNPPLREQRADQTAAPAPPWRERPSPARDGALGSRTPVPPAGSPPAAPGRPPGPSWLDRHEAPAGPELPEVDEDVPAEGAAPGSATPEDVMPEDVTPEATARKATAQQAGTAPRADAARADTPEIAQTAEPALGAAAAADAVDAGEAGANDTGSSESSTKQVTVVPGVPRYHLEDCILIRFMADDDMQKMTLKQATEAGCTPCRACQPGTEAT